MWTTGELFCLTAACVVLLMGVVLVKDGHRDRCALASLAFILAIAGHLVAPSLASHGAPRPIVHAAVLLGLAVPFTFWILTKAHFEDDFTLGPVHWVDLVILVGVGYASWLLVEGQLPGAALLSDAHRTVWSMLPRLLSVAVLIHALFKVYMGARSDLVVPRIRLRYLVLILSGTYVTLEVLAEAVVQGAAALAVADRVHAVSTFVLVFGLATACFRIDPAALRPEPVPAEAPTPDPALAERLRHLIDVEHVYRQEGLTIAALAERVGAQEYRVRQLINSQLGFRNFNAFLHHYRIEEARRALADPDRRHMTVSQIAYEVGYGSLGPFNRAFKDISGRTPTDFRAATQAIER